MTAGLAAVGSRDGLTAFEAPTTGPEMPHNAAPAPGVAGWHGDTAHALSVPHALRDGRFWEYAGPAVPTGEHYDLVVVGAGTSGLTAAAEWLRAAPDARVLILDNHERLGERRRGPGHAPYDSVMCDRETFPVETLVRYEPEGTAERWISRLPVADRARADLLRLYRDAPDWFPRLSAEEKQERLAGLTYSDFLLKVCGAHPDVERFCRTMSSAAWAYDTRAFGAIDAWGSTHGRTHGHAHGHAHSRTHGDARPDARRDAHGPDHGPAHGWARGWDYPGFDGLGLDAGKPSRFNAPSVQRDWRRRPGDPQDPMDPVDPLIPGSGRGAGGPARRRRPGPPGDPVRLRLSSPVVSVRDEGPPGARERRLLRRPRGQDRRRRGGDPGLLEHGRPLPDPRPAGRTAPGTGRRGAAADGGGRGAAAGPAGVAAGRRHPHPLDRRVLVRDGAGRGGQGRRSPRGCWPRPAARSWGPPRGRPRGGGRCSGRRTASWSTAPATSSPGCSGPAGSTRTGTSRGSRSAGGAMGTRPSTGGPGTRSTPTARSRPRWRAGGSAGSRSPAPTPPWAGPAAPSPRPAEPWRNCPCEGVAAARRAVAELSLGRRLLRPRPARAESCPGNNMEHPVPPPASDA